MSEEWERTKEALKGLEDAPSERMGAGHPGYQMIVNAQIAKALRLIMEELEILALTQGAYSRPEAIAIIEKRRR